MRFLRISPQSSKTAPFKLLFVACQQKIFKTTPSPSPCNANIPDQIYIKEDHPDAIKRRTGVTLAFFVRIGDNRQVILSLKDETWVARIHLLLLIRNKRRLISIKCRLLKKNCMKPKMS